jgi:outer membrane protein assembly factor BamB
MLVIVSGMLVVLLAGSAAAQDWPQWRGPDRNGTAGIELPDPWPASLEQAWQVQVGEGHSGPVVAGDLVVVLSRQGDNEVVQALSLAEGKQIWRAEHPVPYTPAPPAEPHGKGPFATPTIAGGKVYTFGVSGILSCFELDSGKLAWRKESAKEFKSGNPAWGAANSPLIYRDRCIIALGGDSDGALVALDKDSGEEIWRYKLEDGPAYASPMTAVLVELRTVVTMTRSRIVALDIGNGMLFWEHDLSTRYDMNIIDPMVYKNHLVCSGYNRGTTAFEILKGPSPTQAWHNDQVSMYMSSPVFFKDHLFGLSQRGSGSLVCLSVADGKVIWSSDESFGKYASIIRAGERLLVTKSDGELVVIAADPAKLTVLGRSKLSDKPVWAPLALTGKYLLVKDESRLSCLRLE